MWLWFVDEDGDDRLVNMTRVRDVYRARKNNWLVLVFDTDVTLRVVGELDDVADLLATCRS